MCKEPSGQVDSLATKVNELSVFAKGGLTI